MNLIVFFKKAKRQESLMVSLIKPLKSAFKKKTRNDSGQSFLGNILYIMVWNNKWHTRPTSH
jgi:hypothetical protein